MPREGLSLFTLFGRSNAALTTYPQFTLLNKITFTRDYDLVGAQFTMAFDSGALNLTSLLIVAGTDLPQITLNESTQVITALGGGSAAYVSKSLWQNFGDYVVRIGAQSPISLYGAGGPSSPAFPLVGIASLYLVPTG